MRKAAEAHDRAPEVIAFARAAREDPASREALNARSPAELSAQYRGRALPPLLQREMTTFLERYGHRAIAEIDLGVKRWSEDPAHLLGAIANYLRLGDEATAPDVQFARGAREAEAMIKTLVSRLHGPRRVVLRFLLGRVRLLGGLREQPKFQIMRVFALGHALIAPVGAVLEGASFIEAVAFTSLRVVGIGPFLFGALFVVVALRPRPSQ